MFRFGIGFSDGTKVTDAMRFGRRGQAEPGERVLHPRGGGGGWRRYGLGFWCAPPPPPGPMSFVCSGQLGGWRSPRSSLRLSSSSTRPPELKPFGPMTPTSTKSPTSLLGAEPRAFGLGEGQRA